MRIVHLIAPAAAGGAESAVRSLAIGQRELGHQVQVATLTSRTTGAHPYVERLQADGIPVTDIRTDRLDYLAESRAVGTLLVQHKADVLHTHVYHADTVGYVASSTLGVPQVATMHGFTGGSLRLAAYTKFDMWVLRRCAAVIAVSPNVRDAAHNEGIKPERVHLIPNGYSQSLVTPLERHAARDALEVSHTAPVIGWIGRLSEEKGADMALEAFAKVRPTFAELCLIGDGPERINLEMIARHTRPAGRVHFAGRVNDAARYLNAFDALVLSSRSEGTPMVLLEAMAAKLPIVSFAVGGVPAMLTPESALLVAPGDVRGLARALTFALSCRVAAAERATAARRVFDEQYTVSTCAWRTIRIYNDVTRVQFEPMAAPAPAKRLPRLQPVASRYIQAGR